MDQQDLLFARSRTQSWSLNELGVFRTVTVDSIYVVANKRNLSRAANIKSHTAIYGENRINSNTTHNSIFYYNR